MSPANETAAPFETAVTYLELALQLSLEANLKFSSIEAGIGDA